MSKPLIFIYDGECPFCNKFAELLELKSNIPQIEIKDARTNPPEIPNGYDMDLKGAILINGDQMFFGSEAINLICSKIDKPSDSILELLRIIFSSRKQANLLFPFLLISRRIALLFKGVPNKILD